MHEAVCRRSVCHRVVTTRGPLDPCQRRHRYPFKITGRVAAFAVIGTQLAEQDHRHDS
jgi:hypothetical protein